MKRRDMLKGLGGMAAAVATVPLASLVAQAPVPVMPITPISDPPAAWPLRSASYRLENNAGRLTVFVVDNDGTKIGCLGSVTLLDGDTLTLERAISLSFT
jgi:hypothetical protein